VKYEIATMPKEIEKLKSDLIAAVDPKPCAVAYQVIAQVL